MGVTWIPSPSRILSFSFHIILILLQQTTAERELKFVVVVSRFVFYFVVGNTGNLVWLLNQTTYAVALPLFRLRNNYYCIVCELVIMAYLLCAWKLKLLVLQKLPQNQKYFPFQNN